MKYLILVSLKYGIIVFMWKSKTIPYSGQGILFLRFDLNSIGVLSKQLFSTTNEWKYKPPSPTAWKLYWLLGVKERHFKSFFQY